VYLIPSVLVLIIFVAALADIITRDQSQVKHLPKVAWILLVIFLPLIGSILWFAIGREWNRPEAAVPFGDPRRRETVSPATPGLSSTEAQLAALDAEIVAAQQQERIRRLEAELEAKRTPRPRNEPSTGT
jgi:hypothetical protein